MPNTISLDRLHDVIQIVMGWNDEHLYFFQFKDRIYLEKPENEDELPSDAFRLGELIKRKGQKFDYLYDFGDHWIHNLVLENSNFEDSRIYNQIYCLESEGDCPPEDSGGIYVYMDRSQRSHEDMDSEESDERDTPFLNNSEVYTLDAVNGELGKYYQWTRDRVLAWDPDDTPGYEDEVPPLPQQNFADLVPDMPSQEVFKNRAGKEAISDRILINAAYHLRAFIELTWASSNERSVAKKDHKLLLTWLNGLGDMVSLDPELLKILKIKPGKMEDEVWQEMFLVSEGLPLLLWSLGLTEDARLISLNDKSLICSLLGFPHPLKTRALLSKARLVSPEELFKMNERLVLFFFRFLYDHQGKSPEKFEATMRSLPWKSLNFDDFDWENGDLLFDGVPWREFEASVLGLIEASLGTKHELLIWLMEGDFYDSPLNDIEIPF